MAQTTLRTDVSRGAKSKIVLTTCLNTLTSGTTNRSYNACWDTKDYPHGISSLNFSRSSGRKTCQCDEVNASNAMVCYLKYNLHQPYEAFQSVSWRISYSLVLVSLNCKTAPRISNADSFVGTSASTT